ncbi:phosphatidylethanolamine N-methyltransferase [Cytospora paraplurivora]|uniref:Phosphatidylethanolamine N-methyltransferase n=1 Tax=Cytospora paraplurivora TaxID=2898453 RepID=A0AAN9U2L5_9PEZI
MAEPASLDITAVQAVVTWIGTDGHKNYLYRQDNDVPFQVTLDIKYDRMQGQSASTGLFRLHVPVHLKASPLEKTPLLLYIRPERVASLLCQHSDEPETSDEISDLDTLVRAKLGPRIVCLKFVLKHHADMVVPAGVSLVPTKQKPHGEQMDLLKDLAHNTSFSVFLKAQDVGSPVLLQDFVDATTDPTRSVRCNADAYNITTLYSGRGGRVLNDIELHAPVSPPSYENVGAPPPMAPLDLEEVAGPSTSSESRKRRRDSGMDEASSGPGVEATCKNIMENILRQARQEDRAFVTNLVTTEIKTLKTEIMAEIQSSKMKLIQYIDGCTDELEYKIHDVEKRLEETDQHIDVQVDDAIISYKVEVEEEKETFKTEMREFVLERLDEVQESAVEDVEERVMDRLNGASVLVEQARLSLE